MTQSDNTNWWHKSMKQIAANKRKVMTYCDNTKWWKKCWHKEMTQRDETKCRNNIFVGVDDTNWWHKVMYQNDDKKRTKVKKVITKYLDSFIPI